MKLSSKPKSSPGRTDDFPPPLMMFPRSKSSRGSRSRGNPMFVRKINNCNENNQEPSSPKVTCIGQVRVKRSNNKHTTATRTTDVRRCKWLRKLKPRWFRRDWRKTFSCFRCNCCKKSEKLREPKQIEVKQIKREIGDVVEADNDKLTSESPPRNAFLLTRSRSAPYRSSSLANKIWESKREEKREDDETGMRVGEKIGVNEGSEGINEDIGKENRDDEGSIHRVEEFKAKPLNLSRCKSEPARLGDKLFMSFSFSS